MALVGVPVGVCVQDGGDGVKVALKDGVLVLVPERVYVDTDGLGLPREGV